MEPQSCAPTQQSDSADLETGWSLEAFGGVDIDNNGKLAKDLRKLTRVTLDGKRAFLAARENAWQRSFRDISDGEWRKITAKCSKSHGGPFSICATVTRIGDRNGIMVFEAHSISETHGE